jgi:hypothetical protein
MALPLSMESEHHKKRLLEAWLKYFRRDVWPPHLNPLGFSVGNKRKTLSTFPLPTTLISTSVTDANAQVDADMLRQIWHEIAYRWDICRVTRGSHIEHLRPTLYLVSLDTTGCSIFVLELLKFLSVQLVCNNPVFSLRIKATLKYT